MKLLIFILSFCAVASHSFAQKSILKIRKGFYLNPNFNHTEYRYKLQNHQAGMQKDILFSPNLTLGYLWGNKNRHNISVTSLRGVFANAYINVKATLNYSYDILAFRKNKFSFYISPYLAGGIDHYNTELITGNGSSQLTNTYASLSGGVAPVFEYKLGKRIDFVASLPLEIYSQQYSNVTNLMNNQPYKVQHNDGFFLNQGQARIGVRLNLFKK